MSQYLAAEHKDYCMWRMQVMERDARRHDRGGLAILEAQLQRRALIWDYIEWKLRTVLQETPDLGKDGKTAG